MSSRHSFAKKQIPEGIKFVDETCACGARRRKYASGASAYFQADGTIMPTPTPPHIEGVSDERREPKEPAPAEHLPRRGRPPGKRPSQNHVPGGTIFAVSDEKKAERVREREKEIKKVLEWPASMTKEKQDAEVKRVKDLMAPHEERYQREQLAKVGIVAEHDARLKDAYVIINLLYADLVAARIWSVGRRMAGTFLYSAGYTAYVKQIEKEAI